MPTIIKSKLVEKGIGHAILSDKVESHENDPVVIRKVEKAVKTLKRIGLPRGANS